MALMEIFEDLDHAYEWLDAKIYEMDATRPDLELVNCGIHLIDGKWRAGGVWNMKIGYRL